MSKKFAMDFIKKNVLKCEKCSLYKTRIKPVFGEGFLDADIMFIGEAPGKNEDIYGRPFIGRAGKILDEMLDSIGIKRNEVFISNIIKCRPPKNRDPTKDEISICSSYIDKQIEIINPKIIILLGRIAIYYIFNKYKIEIEKINKIHGRVYSINNSKIIPIYHPAAVIYNNKLKEILLEDFKLIKDKI